MKHWSGYLIFVITLCLFASISKAQEQATQYELSRPLSFYEVRVIDTQYRPVRGLQISDFQVTENGKTHEIRHFRAIQEASINLAVLLDVGPAIKDSKILKGKRLIFDLIHRLGTEDRIQIAVYDSKICFLSTLTSDRFQLLEALSDISPGMACGKRESRWAVEDGGAQLPHGGNEVPRGRDQGGQTGTTTAGQAAARVFFRTGQSLSGSAITEALTRLEPAEENQRVVLAISAGLPNMGEATLRDLRMEEANLFAVNLDSTAEDLLSLGITRSTRQALVEGSGGFLFSEDSILSRIAELRDLFKNYYLLGLADDPDDRLDPEDLEFQVGASPSYQVTAAPVSGIQE